MRPIHLFLGLVAVSSCLAFAGPAVAQTNDRLAVSVSGSTLSRSDDGGGAIAVWLHDFTPSTILGVGAEYQTIGDADWTLGSLSFAYGRGSAERRSNYYAEAHIGSGKDTIHSFNYSIVTVGLIQNITRRFGLLLEDKQIDINTTHGNLPKVGAQMLWSPRLLTSVSYAHSPGDNLGTRLGSVRADIYGKQWSFIVGGAFGKATPAVLDIQTGIETPGLTLREGFVGVSRPFSSMDVTLLADYLKLGETDRIDLVGTERFTVTLNATVHLHGRPR